MTSHLAECCVIDEHDARDTVILNGARDLNMENAAMRAIVELSVEVLSNILALRLSAQGKSDRLKMTVRRYVNRISVNS